MPSRWDDGGGLLASLREVGRLASALTGSSMRTGRNSSGGVRAGFACAKTAPMHNAGFATTAPEPSAMGATDQEGAAMTSARAR